jgi:transcriptional regulator with XRE-family HTH domain
MRVNTQNLIGAMCRKNIDQAELAHGAGVAQGTVSAAVNGKRGLRIETINKISAFLDMKPEELVGEVAG